jgi:glycosyltransferase involved in cell wall biosynthesis
MVAGISMVRDEADILPVTVGNMLRQVDWLLIADNGSVDGTRELLKALDRVTVVDDSEVGYYQSQKMSALAERAMREGADWVVPFDADEIWYSPFAHRIADELAERDESVCRAAVYDHVATHGCQEFPPPYRRRDAIPLPKVACRTRPGLTIHQGNHGCDFGPTIDGRLVVRHFPYRSVEQFVRKVRNGSQAYAATDLPEDIGQHWRDYGRLTDEQLDDVFHRYFWSANPAEDGLIYDPPPCLPSPSPTETAAPTGNRR